MNMVRQQTKPEVRPEHNDRLLLFKYSLFPNMVAGSAAEHQRAALAARFFYISKVTALIAQQLTRMCNHNI